MVFTPDYLKVPTLKGHLYGALDYDANSSTFIISGDGLIMEFTKRLFPGSRPGWGEDKGKVFIKDSRKAAEDINWLLLRFPLKVSCMDRLNRGRADAIERINRRATQQDMVQTTPPKEFLGKLMGFQESAVTFISTNKRVLLSDTMGLGKSWSSLAAAAHAGEYPVLVVCQTHVLQQWQRVIGQLFDMGTYQTEFSGDPVSISEQKGRSIAPILSGRTPYQIPDTPFTLIHYGLLQNWSDALMERKYPFIIFDEVQELRHTGTMKYSAASVLSSDADHVVGCSGSPIYGYGAEIWNVTNIIDFNCLGSFESFTREWCEGYGEKRVRDPKALNDLLVREGLMLRRTYKDPEVQVSVPTVDRKIIDVDHDTEVYDKLIAATRKKADGYSSAHFTKKGRIARDVERETRQATGISKAPYAAEFIKSLVEAGEKPLVYAWHHAVHDILKEDLKDSNPSFISGKQTTKQKDAMVKRFINGDTDVCILSLRSAAGIDGLQYRGTCVVFVELDWSPAIFSQCEHRLARIGVNELVKSIPAYYCVSNTGYDEIMQDVLGIKVAQFIGLMGDEPETHEEKKEAEERAIKRIEKLIDKLKE